MNTVGANPLSAQETTRTKPHISPCAFSIAEFCEMHGGITRQHFHSIVKRGKGPRTFKVGKRTLISREAAAEWVARMELETATLNT